MYMIYCDVKTLVNCTQQQLDDIIKKNTRSCYKLNDCVWFVEIRKNNFESFFGATDDFLNDYIEQYTDDNSIFVIVELTRSTMYNLPDEACQFIGELPN